MTIYEVFYNDCEALESRLYFEKPPQFDWLLNNSSKLVSDGYEWASTYEVDDDLVLAAIPLEKILTYVSKQHSRDVLNALDAIVPDDEKGKSYVDKVLSSLTPAQVFGWLAEQTIAGGISLKDSIRIDKDFDPSTPPYTATATPIDLESYIPLKEELDAEVDEQVKQVKPL